MAVKAAVAEVLGGVGSSLKDCEYLPGHVALQAADGFLLGFAVADAAGQVVLGSLVVA
jgi:hypothetical protein